MLKMTLSYSVALALLSLTAQAAPQYDIDCTGGGVLVQLRLDKTGKGTMKVQSRYKEFPATGEIAQTVAPMDPGPDYSGEKAVGYSFKDLSGIDPADENALIDAMMNQPASKCMVLFREKYVAATADMRATLLRFYPKGGHVAHMPLTCRNAK